MSELGTLPWSETVTGSPAATGETIPPGVPQLPARYRDEGRIAAGGFGEIRRVHDLQLDRVVAMKLLRADVAGAAQIQARFLAETRLTAGLEHPGIVGVYDSGQLDDGRLWFTMREVRGRTFGAVIDELHAAASREGFRETASGWTFRRLVDAFARVCQAVAYAHRRDIVHRDLKPDNLMVGELGEALVMDWGLGRRVGARAVREEGAGAEAVDDANSQLTRHGDVLGTPAYMPPEQARGERALHGLASDVYALGAVLYCLLTGRHPYEGGSAVVVLKQVLAGPPAPIAVAAEGKPISAELAAICDKAMQREMSARYPDAEALAGEVVAWLDGARRREQALAVVAQAREMETEIARLRAQGAEKRAEARVRLDGVRPFDPVECKEPGWALEDEAERLEAAATLREAEWLQTLQGALTVDPELPEAHAALADHHRDALLAAERAHRGAEAVRAEAFLRAHDRGRHARLLRGEGAVTLVTDPPGAVVRLERYVLRGRQLVPQECGVIGVTPLRELPLQQGSYRLRISAPGRHEVKYPVLIERGGHWDGVAPGETEASPVHLPEQGELGDEECYVPAGWCWTGGDPEAPDSLPSRRLWVDGLIVGRYPVTNREYLRFLNDLVAAGREREAEIACPQREPGAVEGSEKHPVFDRDARGSFVLPNRGQHPVWQLDFPVVQLDWHAASAHARWLAGETGRPWRLLNEIEREKAARGVDARSFPWGSQGDASFACVLEGHRGEPAREAVSGHAVDESVYGARGLAGNVRDWCINLWKQDGPLVERGRLRTDEASPEDDGFRTVHGGFWGGPIAYGRSASRFGSRPSFCRFSVGLRVARSYPVLPGAPG